MTTETEVNIVVLTHNALQYTKTTVERIFATVKIPYYLTLIDNGSKDGTKEYLGSISAKGKCKKIITQNNAYNLGVARALNQAFKITKELQLAYLCKCDNDLYFWDPWLEPMLETIKQGNDTGIVAPLRISKYTKCANSNMNCKDKQALIQDCSPEDELYHFFDSTNTIKSVKSLITINGGGVEEVDSIPSSIPGHCELIRMSALKKIGFLADERYKRYGTDDIDLCWEMFEHKYKIIINKNVFVYHFRHKSLPNNKVRDNILKSNNIEFYKKWKHKIDPILNSPDFANKIKDGNNEKYDILRYMINNWESVL